MLATFIVSHVACNWHEKLSTFVTIFFFYTKLTSIVNVIGALYKHDEQLEEKIMKLNI